MEPARQKIITEANKREEEAINTSAAYCNLQRPLREKSEAIHLRLRHLTFGCSHSLSLSGGGHAKMTTRNTVNPHTRRKRIRIRPQIDPPRPLAPEDNNVPHIRNFLETKNAEKNKRESQRAANGCSTTRPLKSPHLERSSQRHTCRRLI